MGTWLVELAGTELLANDLLSGCSKPIWQSLGSQLERSCRARPALCYDDRINNVLVIRQTKLSRPSSRNRCFHVSREQIHSIVNEETTRHRYEPPYIELSFHHTTGHNPHRM